MRNTIFTILIALTANFLLTSCSLIEGKQTVSNRQEDGVTARAYTSETTATGETKWARLNTQPAIPASATPKNLSDIETAAGPGATAATANPNSRLDYVPGDGYNN